MTSKTKSDAELYDSAAMNATASVKSAVRNDGGVRIVFIGNSITLHEKAPQIGWHNEWGMAASAAEKDYVHLVTAEIERRLGCKADVRVRNLADFERGFKTYDFAQIQDLVDFQLCVSNNRMFPPEGSYDNSIGDDKELINAPCGTFKRLNVDNIDILVDEGAMKPECSIVAQPGSSFGDIDIRDVRQNGVPLEVKR